MRPKLEVLVSCMYQSDMSILERANISSSAVVVNQCDKDSYEEIFVGENRVRMFSCLGRGLSKSRNKALKESAADICLLCDDDEHLEDDYVSKIQEAYEKYPDADIIAFKLERSSRAYWTTPRRINYLNSLKISSCQISFKRESIVGRGIFFDEAFGSGARYSFGEENIFLYECLRKGLKAYYLPIKIAFVSEEKSTWFNGFVPQYFFDRGVVTQRCMGRFFASLYAIYFAVFKYSRYKAETPFRVALKKMIEGIYQN